jgi:hypothetical protein
MLYLLLAANRPEILLVCEEVNMNHFHKYGYYLLSDFFTQEEVDGMYKADLANDNLTISEIYKTAQVRLEGLLDTDLLPNFYQRDFYRDNEVEEERVETASCEITLTFTVANNGKNWPIALNTSKGIKYISTDPGDALIYRACDIPNSRVRNTFNDMQIQYNMFWNDVNSEIGSYLRHFNQDQRINMDFNLNEIRNQSGDKLPLWDN